MITRERFKQICNNYKLKYTFFDDAPVRPYYNIINNDYNITYYPNSSNLWYINNKLYKLEEFKNINEEQLIELFDELGFEKIQNKQLSIFDL